MDEEPDLAKYRLKPLQRSGIAVATNEQPAICAMVLISV